ncbi:MAG: hypothetical protein IH865_05875 [Chloroflexi bacterium]|nr:hypothetical protein [Chloroflexota bacterium]
MRLRNPSVRLSIGLAAVFALALVVVAIGMNSDSPPASADTTTPTKILNNGSLGGVNDILVHDGTKTAGLFYCIGKTDHQVNGTETDTTPDEIKTSLQCNIDIPGLGETDQTPPGWCDLANACNPNEPGADLIPGSPPPPPYTVMAPSKGYGYYYHDGVPAVCGGTPCTVVTSCFQDVGGPTTLGPNMMWTVVLFDPLTANPSEGVVDIFYNQNNASCKAGTPKGPTNLSDLALNSWLVYDKSLTLTGEKAPWRPSSNPGATDLNFDGDACDDLDELDKNSNEKCGDDPQNPTDSFPDPNTVDLSGSYDITTRLARADCSDAQDCAGSVLPGIYIYCRADLQHDTDTNDLTMRVYCYADNPAIEVNSQAYPGAFGDGFSGGPPPGPRVAAYASGFSNWVYGDVDITHTVLTGTFNKSLNNIQVAGCILDPDGTTGTGDVWFDFNASAHQLPGTVSVYLFQSADCAGSPSGSPVVAELAFAKQAQGRARDADNDGVPRSRELQDNDACGRRDPYNGNDYYDVSVPRDGVIDLSNDILGVIQHYEPGGYVSGDPDVLGGIPDPTTFDNFDRPPTMTNALGGTWNRGSPDGVIDLSNDILGVILQYNPGGCPPLP